MGKAQDLESARLQQKQAASRNCYLFYLYFLYDAARSKRYSANVANSTSAAMVSSSRARDSPVGSGCTAAVYRDAEAKQSFYDFAMNINWEAVNRVFAAFSAARSYSGGNGGGSNLGSAGSTGVTAPAVQALKKICDARRYAGISAVLHERYGLSHMMPGGVAPRARPQRDIHIF